MKILKKYIVLISMFIFLSPLGAEAMLDVESGVVFFGYNDVQIPAEIGTMFSLSEETPSDPIPMFRIRAGYTFSDKHIVSILAAPFTVQGSGIINNDVSFQGVTFSEGSKVTSRYRFDSYRLTYRYTFLKNENLNIGVGLTAKIRSADISLMSDSGYANRSDLGIVPLINFRTEWFFNESFGLLLDGDALVTPFGRAEDINLALLYNYSPGAVFRIGYRVLEGGSDGGGDVYTFALFHFVTAGITLTF